jgi:hypothetical protein
LALCCWLEKEKKMGNGVEAEWGSGCFGTEFCFQGRERRPVEGEEKNQKMGGLVDVPLVCRIEGGGERLLWEKRRYRECGL